MTVPAPVTRQPPPARAPSTTRELGAAAVLILVGGGAALLASSRAWDTVTVQRAAPLGPFSVDVLGRTIAPAVAGLAVVALAGVIALLATRGRARVVMGAVLAVAGGLLAWQSATGFPTISDARARSLAASARTGVVLERGEAVDVSTAAIWPIVALLGALLVIAGGIVVVIRGATWASMSSRYDAPAATVELAAGRRNGRGSLDSGADVGAGAEVRGRPGRRACPSRPGAVAES